MTEAKYTREAERLLAAVDQIKAAFGAPGDYGYETREGKALYELYLARAAYFSAKAEGGAA